MTNADVAIGLARAGHFIFPCSQDKTPLIAAWRKNSTTDIHTIHQYWMGRRGALVGLDCGKSGLLVDIKRTKADAVGLSAMCPNSCRQLGLLDQLVGARDEPDLHQCRERDILAPAT